MGGGDCVTGGVVVVWLWWRCGCGVIVMWCGRSVVWLWWRRGCGGGVGAVWLW